jgi:RNA binding exosome subunit
MKQAHYVEMRVFCKEGEDEQTLVNKIKEVFPFDFEKEKIKFRWQTAEVFENKKLKIFYVTADKERHIKKVLALLFEKIPKEDKEILLNQLESRLDNSLHFFLRLDKDKMMEGEYKLTETGNCFHFTIAIAAYPHRREIAVNIVKRILNS